MAANFIGTIEDIAHGKLIERLNEDVADIADKMSRERELESDLAASRIAELAARTRTERLERERAELKINQDTIRRMYAANAMRGLLANTTTLTESGVAIARAAFQMADDMRAAEGAGAVGKVTSWCVTPAEDMEAVEEAVEQAYEKLYELAPAALVDELRRHEYAKGYQNSRKLALGATNTRIVELEREVARLRQLRQKYDTVGALNDIAKICGRHAGWNKESELVEDVRNLKANLELAVEQRNLARDRVSRYRKERDNYKERLEAALGPDDTVATHEMIRALRGRIERAIAQGESYTVFRDSADKLHTVLNILRGE